ncbi:hypothetical protein SESBI_14363 [Sesbania bispinosa]|nr:hypothetical protein SESBI_14363 [Sesbania bispinosa]
MSGKDQATSSKTKSSPRKAPLFPSKEIENLFNSNPFLERQKIGTFFGEDLKVYHFLTRTFYAYACIEWYGERTPRIRSCIKGKEMLIDHELICGLIGLTSEGIFLYNEKDRMEVANVTKEEVGAALFTRGKMTTEVRHLTNIGKRRSFLRIKIVSIYQVLISHEDRGSAPTLPSSLLPTPPPKIPLSSQPVNPNKLIPRDNPTVLQEDIITPGEDENKLSPAGDEECGAGPIIQETPATQKHQVYFDCSVRTPPFSPPRTSVQMTPNTFAASLLKSSVFDKSIPMSSSSQSELPKEPSGSIGTFLDQLEKGKIYSRQRG